MANRIIKESINESNGLSKCSIFAQDLYKRLITYADDYGRFNADTQIMIARLFPREIDIVTHDDIITGLIELCGVGKIAFYTSSPRKEVYGCFPNWGKHQRIRDSKQKCPEPTDTTINDWYYRRFIPLFLKIQILERDKFKCQICKKPILQGEYEAKKLIKMCSGLFHIDHIVPCNQGGRATLENLQLTCPKCNLTRKRFFQFEEILAFAEHGEDLQEFAASCGELPPNPIQSNPILIQSESNPNPNRSIENLFNYWNEQKIIIHKDVTPDIQKALEKALKQDSEEDIKTSIIHYGIMLHDENYGLCSYKWSLVNFLSREKGYRLFMNNGEKWLNYPKSNTESKPTSITRDSPEWKALFGDKEVS